MHSQHSTQNQCLHFETASVNIVFWLIPSLGKWNFIYVDTLFSLAKVFPCRMHGKGLRQKAETTGAVYSFPRPRFLFCRDGSKQDCQSNKNSQIEIYFHCLLLSIGGKQALKHRKSFLAYRNAHPSSSLMTWPLSTVYHFL